ncbi:MAG: hypothetical protein BMS9Abin21_105 [Thermodesulfovibrionia bacterium]|nr:MAG: hypothetical protein BMS9Abin21_105 [Thermodesulfovibrionia bacterium]
MTTLTTRSGKGSSLTHAELDANFPQASQTKAGAYTLAESDNRDTVEYSGAGGDSFTLPDAATVAAASDTGDWEVTVHHKGSGVLTIARTTGADTINGTAANDTITANVSVTYKVNQAGDGFNRKAGSDNLVALLTTAGDILYASAANTLARLAIGNSGQIPSVNAGETAPVYWAPMNYISGLEVTSNGAAPTTDIDIAVGECADSGNTNILKPAAVTREVDGAYGTGNGGLSSSLTVAANTTYYVHAIRIGTTEDVGFDTSATAANLITDHTVTEYRQIGSFSTNSGNTNINTGSIRNLGSSIRPSVITATELADNSVSPKAIGGTVTAGDYLAASIVEETNTTSTSFVKVKEISIPFGGEFRIKFQIKDSGAFSRTASGRIYKNGGAIGSTQTTTSTSYVLKTQDLSGFVAGDLIQLYIKISVGDDSCFVKDLILYTNETESDYVTLQVT